jgi:hypothetical protein
MTRSSSLFFCAVSTTWSNGSFLLFVLLSGLRSPSSSTSVVVRLERVIGTVVLALVVSGPQSSSGSESSSESELRTTCSPLDTTLLLAPELTDVCDVGGGCASGLVVVAVRWAGGTGEVFEIADAVVVIWAEVAWPRWRLDVLDGANGVLELLASDAAWNVSLAGRGEG